MDPAARASRVAVGAAVVSLVAAAVAIAPAASRVAWKAQALVHRVQAPAARHLVVCIGDSITSFGYPARVSALLGSDYRVSNEGVSGETSAQILGRWRFGIQETRPAVLVVLGGVNDLRIGTGFAAPAIANLQELMLEAQQVGTKVVALTVLPFRGDRYWTEGLEHERQAINQALLEHCTEHPAVSCVDAAATMSRGDQLAPEFDSGDGIHLSENGSMRLAELVADAIAPARPGR
jgi:lysophospholipase L1-like esterase